MSAPVLLSHVSAAAAAAAVGAGDDAGHCSGIADATSSVHRTVAIACSRADFQRRSQKFSTKGSSICSIEIK